MLKLNARSGDEVFTELKSNDIAETRPSMAGSKDILMSLPCLDVG